MSDSGNKSPPADPEPPFPSLRLSPEDYEVYHKEVHGPLKPPIYKLNPDSESDPKVRLVGYNDEATEAIKASDNGAKGYLDVYAAPKDSVARALNSGMGSNNG